MQEENILLQIRDNSLAISDALKKISPLLIQNTLFGYVDDSEGEEEYIEGLNWGAISNYLKEINWCAADLYSKGFDIVSIKQYPNLARNNARWVAEEAIKDFLNKIKTCPQEEIEDQQGYCHTGVFEAFAYTEEGSIILEVNFKPKGAISSCSIEEE